jgi:large subunit ribosomal protein L37e
MKGTPSMGLKNRVTHMRCRRCGRVAFKRNTRVCAACGYGKEKKIRSYSWQTHTANRQRRKTSRNQRKLAKMRTGSHSTKHAMR